MNAPMKYKVLVNKHNGMFGVFHQRQIWDSATPELLGNTTTMESLRKFATQSGSQVLELENPEELERYDLKEVSLQYL